MNLQSVAKRINRKMGKKRVGRGAGSGKGFHTTGRGMKGQKSRTGHKSTAFFEGGNVPFFRKIPKLRGFKKNDKIEYQAVNLSVLEDNYKDGEIVNLVSLQEKGLVKKRTSHVKILAKGEIKKKVSVEGIKVSDAAKAKILEKKGSVN